MEQLKENTIYNFWCLEGCNKKNIQATGKNSKCPTCNKKMKALGIATNITHIGTQESKIR